VNIGGEEKNVYFVKGWSQTNSWKLKTKELVCRRTRGGEKEEDHITYSLEERKEKKLNAQGKKRDLTRNPSSFFSRGRGQDISGKKT